MNDKYDEPMLRLSDAKLMSWLRRKTDAVERHLTATAASVVADEGQSLTQFGEEHEFAATAAPAARTTVVSAIAVGIA